MKSADDPASDERVLVPAGQRAPARASSSRALRARRRARRRVRLHLRRPAPRSSRRSATSVARAIRGGCSCGRSTRTASSPPPLGRRDGCATRRRRRGDRAGRGDRRRREARPHPPGRTRDAALLQRARARLKIPSPNGMAAVAAGNDSSAAARGPALSGSAAAPRQGLRAHRPLRGRLRDGRGDARVGARGPRRTAAREPPPDAGRSGGQGEPPCRPRMRSERARAVARARSLPGRPAPVGRAAPGAGGATRAAAGLARGRSGAVPEAAPPATRLAAAPARTATAASGPAEAMRPVTTDVGFVRDAADRGRPFRDATPRVANDCRTAVLH